MGSDTGAGHCDRRGGEAGKRAAAPPGAAEKALRWRQVFTGEVRQIGVLRRWLASLLPDCAARDDLFCVASELGSNALRHTRSGRGGCFGVEITWDRSAVRVAVADSGGHTEPRVIDDPAAEYGRGLLLVRGLSVRMGVVGDQRGRLMWADVPWPASAGAAQAFPDPYETSIRHGETVLARRFAGVHAWFGQSTLAWWALAGPGELVTAPSAQELAALLYRLRNAPPGPPPGLQPAPSAQTQPRTAGRAVARRDGRPGVACGALGQATRVPAPAQSVRVRPLARALAWGGC